LTYARLSTKPYIWCSTRGRAVVARRAHNPEVVGSNPTPATKKLGRQDDFQGHPAFFNEAATPDLEPYLQALAQQVLATLIYLVVLQARWPFYPCRQGNTAHFTD
jgi:hypothetical protein